MTKSTRSTLPYQMGNAGDLLKHGVLAEFVRWRCAQGAAIRFLDFFGGEPFDDGVPDEIVQRVAGLKDTALYEAQPDISKGRYYGSGKLVQRLGELESGSLVSVYVADQDRERRHRLRNSELRVLDEAFPGIESGPKPYDAYAALSRIVSSTRTGDLVLIDPFDRFLPDEAPRVIPEMAEIAKTGSVMLFALNLDPFNAVGRRFDRLVEQHLGSALIMTVPPLRESPIRGESRYYVDLILAGREIGGDGSSTDEFRRCLDDFSSKLAIVLGLSRRGASMLRPRVIGEVFNGNPADLGGGMRNRDEPHSETALRTGPSGQARRPRKYPSNHETCTAYGVDGCREGWFYVELKPSGGIRWDVVSNVEKLVNSADKQACIFIDIPIGLPDDGEDRSCDRAARKALGRPRASSVFPAPARAVLDLDARTYQEANKFSKETVGKGITQQTFAILPKIREVDTLLRSSAKARNLIREVHPELCFWALNCEEPMRFNKSKPEGFRERLDVVKGLMPSAAAEVRRMIRWARGRGVARDDILDALVAAITASQPQEVWETVPACATNDRFGLPMEIVYLTHGRLRGSGN